MDLKGLFLSAYRILYVSVILSAVIASPRITVNLDAQVERAINIEYPEVKQTVMLSVVLSCLASVPMEYSSVPFVRRHLKFWFAMPIIWSVVCCLMFLQNLLLLSIVLHSSWGIVSVGWLIQQIFFNACFFSLALELISHWKVFFDLHMNKAMESHINDDYRLVSPVL